jgi:hypothetical protein
MTDLEFDRQAAHRIFSAECFNRAWDLMDKPERTAQEDEEMIRLSLASQWHWSKRPGCTPTNEATGYWQTARIYALLGQADNARRYGHLSLAASQQEGVAPFYLGYAYEALARAEQVAGNRDQMAVYLAEARRVAEHVPKPEYRKQLEGDLDSIAL